VLPFSAGIPLTWLRPDPCREARAEEERKKEKELRKWGKALKLQQVMEATQVLKAKKTEAALQSAKK